MAVRAQHIKRWTVPRNTYPMTRMAIMRGGRPLYVSRQYRR